MKFKSLVASTGFLIDSGDVKGQTVTTGAAGTIITIRTTSLIPSIGTYQIGIYLNITAYSGQTQGLTTEVDFVDAEGLTISDTDAITLAATGYQSRTYTIRAGSGNVVFKISVGIHLSATYDAGIVILRLV